MLMSSTPIYSLRVNEVFQSLETSLQGLATAEAESRRALYRENLLSEQARPPIWRKYAAQATHPFVLMMIVVGLITLWEGEIALSLAIWLVAVVNAGFSFWREYQAERAVEKLKHLLPTYAHAIRDGKDVHLPAAEIVPGDVLILAEGDNIPADARVVEEYGLRVNNASLTGESLAARKTADASLVSGISELERPNLIFAGTSVASGTGKAVVYATGMLTQFGRIAQLTQTVQEEPSPFQQELNRLSRRLSIVALGIGAFVWLVSVYEPHVRERIEIPPILLALGIIVAITPEGLPVTLTLSLARAVQRLTTRGVLSKRLSIVETLGNLSVICTDKSGTLTQNQMTVREVWTSRQNLQLSGAGYEPRGQYQPDPAGTPFEQDLNALLEAALSCNNARINPPSPEHPTWTSLGDQTEAALKVAALKAGIREASVNDLYPRMHELPFDARRKRMTTIHRSRGGDLAFVKGAPREVLQLCTHISIHGEALPLTEEVRAEIMSANDEYARRALRVLALARRSLPPRAGAYTPELVERELTFLGLMAMMDPPRPEVERAVAACRRAGIRIVMITGDYGLTAESLARRVGMITSSNPTILTGAELDAMDDVALRQALDKEVIFARMAPDHKLRLVSAFQARGEVVAVTGDGVNDAPALRKADVGIAMGLVGTDVAKEAADVILTNDNFDAIVSAIEEGRAIYDNIRKFITYIFSSNVPELVPFLATATFGVPLALTVRQVLAIDMGTDILPALALGIEKPEAGIMEQPPRPRFQPLLDRQLLTHAFLWLGVIEAVLCYLGFAAVYVLSGHAQGLGIPLPPTIPWPHLFSLSADSLERTAQTVFHVGVVMAQVGNVFASRTFKAHNWQQGWFSNPVLWLGVVLELVIIWMLIYVPPLAAAFDHVALPGFFWPALILFAPVLYILEWIRKSFIRRFGKMQPARSS
ncbi:MAG TPA: cation-transporting P-type ATPase [Anaerolineales bacterium]|nr:cation-transporting P-type ATPase [Anaerolineales bacterium]